MFRRSESDRNLCGGGGHYQSAWTRAEDTRSRLHNITGAQTNE